MVSSQGQQGNIFISTSSTPYGPFNEVLLKPPVPSQLFPGGYNYPEDVNQSLYSYPTSVVDADNDGDLRIENDCDPGNDADNDGDCILNNTDSTSLNDNDINIDGCVLFGYNAKEQPDLETNGDIVISYNVNTLGGGCGLQENVFYNVDNYRPRFIIIG